MDDFSTTEIVLDEADAKRARVLDAAFRTVLAYGYNRTTMDDIARAAEMSRPALYLLFKNKMEICRALAASVMKRSVARARTELTGDGSFAERLERAIGVAFLSMMQRFAESPHGAELLDLKTTICGDLVEGWRAELTALFAEAIGDEAAWNTLDLASLGLSAESMAAILMDGLEGMKTRLAAPAAQRQAAQALIQVIARALRA